MFIPTTTLIGHLSAHLEALPLVAADPSGQKLFQRVGVFGSAQLAQAMRATFATEQRVAFIIPGPEGHTSRRDRSLLFSTRTVRVAVLMADRAMDRSKPDALMGGTRNAGILAMKDAVIASLFATAPHDWPVDLAFSPDTGEPLMIAEADQAAGNLGRECWLQWFTAYAGTGRQNVP
jgi:hypothetical protein